MTIENAWLPLVGVLFGSVAAIFGSYFQHRWTAKREAQSRSEQREAELRLKQLYFQRDTLIELQDTMAKLGRATGKAFHQDVVNSRKSGRWQKMFIGDDLSTEHNLLSTRCNVLSSRLSNDQLRQSTVKFVSTCLSTLACDDELQGGNLLLASIDEMRELHDQIGLNIRSIQLN